VKGSEKGLIRSLNRRGTKADKSPPVARKTSLKEPAVCERCGAVYERKTWRSDRRPTIAVLDKATWTICPACEQVAADVYYGRVLITGKGALERRAAIERRVANVARLAASRQPERKVVSQEWEGSKLEILTTSQKLAHRIAKELNKTFGGKASYKWSADDGSLLATWRCPAAEAKG
jgi:NMD protein affecting ribosome stability and mRNA decay